MLKDEGIYIAITFIENGPVVFESLANKQTDKYPFLLYRIFYIKAFLAS